MNNWNRRNLLKALAATSLFSTKHGFTSIQTGQNPCSKVTQAGPSVVQLNVIVHGLVALVFNPSDPSMNVRLLMPEVVDQKPPHANTHVFRAGTYKDLNDYYPIPRIKVPMTTSPQVPALSGVQSGITPVKPDPNYDAVLPLVKANVTVAPTKNYYEVDLPFPGGFYSVHCRKRNDGNPIFGGSDSQYLPKLTQIAGVHVFTYTVGSGMQPVLSGTNWQPEPDGNGIANLHIFAEPVDLVGPGHARKAFKELCALFPKKSGGGQVLDISFNSYSAGQFSSSAQLCPNHPNGETDSDEASLSERGSGKGGQPANCVGLIAQP